MDQIDDAAERVREFYRQVAELQGLLGRAEEGLNAQGMVGTEVEIIKQQLQEFKVGWTSFCSWFTLTSVRSVYYCGCASGSISVSRSPKKDAHQLAWFRVLVHLPLVLAGVTSA